MICPPSTVANRRSPDTRIAVTRGTASLSRAGIGPRRGPGTTGGGVRTFEPDSALSAARAEGFRGDGCGLGAGTLTGGFDFGADATVLTRGGFDFGAEATVLAGGGFDFGAEATVLAGGLDARGAGMFGSGIVGNG